MTPLLIIMTEVEPVDHWLKMLSLEVREDPRKEDFHVLLALTYPPDYTRFVVMVGEDVQAAMAMAM